MSSSAAPPSVRRVASERIVLPDAMATPDTRGRILEAALGLFAERGYAGTSIRDIAGAVGIQSATLYGHFPSKEHILAELAQAGHEAHRRRLADAMAGAGADPVDQLAALVRAHVLFHTEFAMLAIVANAELEALSPELVAGSIRPRSETERLFTGTIDRGIELGRFSTPDAWLAAAAIGGMGLRVASWFGPGARMTADAVADTYVEFALRILGASR
ncbi:TetR/AcrR family transcriptional regulator [Diaminobutyricibacter tongyongensis]|uniref:TetR/AcrR family transcriptional regulator n=1 Tax=Leifsonia tongyongensis TaxID=1268043 RepID=A0A6L9XW16_9MICO|nr:TetR/AcrR family transcriptional regulator [Diaminobutyricibacter tongyongensis]NEN05445.1 TetR/AcrR family transcriptional regulator [Diaminobutyricibacter tongyongensis]